MISPPPLPPSSVDFIRFEGTASGLQTVGFDRKRLEQAQTAAKKWLASQNDIEVVTIESCFGKMAAFVTIWFHRKNS